MHTIYTQKKQNSNISSYQNLKEYLTTLQYETNSTCESKALKRLVIVLVSFHPGDIVSQDLVVVVCSIIDSLGVAQFLKRRSEQATKGNVETNVPLHG